MRPARASRQGLYAGMQEQIHQENTPGIPQATAGRLRDTCGNTTAGSAYSCRPCYAPSPPNTHRSILRHNRGRSRVAPSSNQHTICRTLHFPTGNAVARMERTTHVRQSTSADKMLAQDGPPSPIFAPLEPAKPRKIRAGVMARCKNFQRRRKWCVKTVCCKDGTFGHCMARGMLLH